MCSFQSFAPRVTRLQIVPVLDGFLVLLPAEKHLAPANDGVILYWIRPRGFILRCSFEESRRFNFSSGQTVSQSDTAAKQTRHINEPAGQSLVAPGAIQLSNLFYSSCDIPMVIRAAQNERVCRR